ncbi:MAG: DUF2949 domain-containing protein [Elainellaceae cyanobacterium]
MSTAKLFYLIRFLEDDLSIPQESLKVALRHPEHPTQLPMILWQYGLITLEQLDRVFSWLEMA